MSTDDTVPTPDAWWNREGSYRRLVDSILDYGILMIDTDGTIRTWNPGAEHVKGYTADEAIGQNFSMFYTREQRDAHYPEHELEVAATTGQFEDEGWRVRKDGSKFWANVVITALRDESGSLVGFSKVTRDLTDREEQQEQLRKTAA
jgi:PAS domain S-box-containing protein